MKRRILFNKKLFTALRKLESEYHDLICMEDDETIHDLRVSIRRVTPLIDLYIMGSKNKNTRKKLKTTNKKLKSYFQALSQVRDSQVMIPHLIEMHPTSLAILKKMDMDYRSLHRQIIMQASTWELPALIDEVLLIILKDPFENLGIKSQVKTTLKTQRSLIKGLLSGQINTPEQLHRLRIGLKKYRYTLEMIESLDMSGKVDSKSLKLYQDKLGTFQDLTVLIAYLSEHAPHLPLIEDIFKKHNTLCDQLIQESNTWVKTLKL